MNLSDYKKLTIDGIELKSLTINGVLAWKSGYKNWVKYSTEEDGKTIYNGGKGYKNGYRVRSGGAEGALANASCTGYISVQGGDIVRLSGYDVSLASNANAINVYDADKTNLGQAASNYANSGYGIFTSDGGYSAYGWHSVKENPSGVFNWIVPPLADIAFMRVTGYTNGDGSKMIVTVNEEITG